MFFEEAKKQKEENRVLRDTLIKIKKEHDELEKFIAWMNKEATEKQCQICGIKKINFKHSRNCYIGFFLSSKLEIIPKREYSYTVYGVLSNDPKHSKIYKASLNQHLSEYPLNIENYLEIGDHCVEDIVQRRGIGSSGLTTIKELAKHLHCSYISGKKYPLRDTKEEMAKLTAYYKKNGFVDTGKDDGIRFDMSGYEAKQRLN